MSFIKSVLFGSEGSYNILGVNVSFEKSTPNPFASSSLDINSGNVLINSIAHLGIRCLNNNVFRILTQGYAHAFVHEMGHAFAYRLLTDQEPKVRILTDLCVGETDSGDLWLPSKVNSIISTSGPMANMIFSSCKLATAVALRPYISTPVAVTIGAGAGIWMTGELLLAYLSASNEDFGDFSKIRQSGSKDLLFASMVLIGQCALGVFSAYATYKSK